MTVWQDDHDDRVRLALVEDLMRDAAREMWWARTLRARYAGSPTERRMDGQAQAYRWTFLTLAMRRHDLRAILNRTARRAA